MFRTLEAHGVRYVLIGGLAATLHGSPLRTGDADICPAKDAANLERLARALEAMDARIRAPDAEAGVRFACDARFLAGVELLNLTTRFGDLDIAFRPAGTGGYDDLLQGGTLRPGRARCAGGLAPRRHPFQESGQSTQGPRRARHPSGASTAEKAADVAAPTQSARGLGRLAGARPDGAQPRARIGLTQSSAGAHRGASSPIQGFTQGVPEPLMAPTSGSSSACRGRPTGGKLTKSAPSDLANVRVRTLCEFGP